MSSDESRQGNTREGWLAGRSRGTEDSLAVSIEAARELYHRKGGGHDFDHVLRVLALAIRIAEAEGADLHVVGTAALLHDIGEADGRKDHHLRGASMARELLSGEPPEFVDAVAHAIEAHRFRAEPGPRTPEAQIVSDADKLDAIGAIGIARVFAYAGARGTALWRAPWREIATTARPTPQDPAPQTLQDAIIQPKSLGADYTPVHEYVYKLSQIPEYLYTSTACRMASERLAFMRTFFDRLDEEMADGVFLPRGRLGSSACGILSFHLLLSFWKA